MTAQALYVRLNDLKRDLLAAGFITAKNTRFLGVFDSLLNKLHKASLKGEKQ